MIIIIIIIITIIITKILKELKLTKKFREFPVLFDRSSDEHKEKDVTAESVGKRGGRLRFY